MIGTSEEVKNTIQNAIAKSFVNAKEFSFPLSSGLTSERIGAETHAVYYSPARTVHPSMAPSYTDKGVVVALAHIDQNNNINVVPFEKTENLNNPGYYAKAQQQNEKIIEMLATKLSESIQQQSVQAPQQIQKQSVFTNMDVTAMFKNQIKEYAENDFYGRPNKNNGIIDIQKNENGIYTAKVYSLNLPSVMNYPPPQEVTVGKAVFVQIDGKPECLVSVTKDANIIFDAIAMKNNPQALTNAHNPPTLVNTLYNEEGRYAELSNSLNQSIQLTFEKKSMFYKAFEQELSDALQGKNTQWLSKVAIEENDGIISYGDEQVAVKTGDTVTLTSGGLRFCDKVVSVYTQEEVQTFKDEFKFNDEPLSKIENNTINPWETPNDDER